MTKEREDLLRVCSILEQKKNNNNILLKTLEDLRKDEEKLKAQNEAFDTTLKIVREQLKEKYID